MNIIICQILSSLTSQLLKSTSKKAVFGGVEDIIQMEHFIQKKATPYLLWYGVESVQMVQNKTFEDKWQNEFRKIRRFTSHK